MAAAPEPPDVTVCADAAPEGGTLVRVVARGAIRMADVMPVFDMMDLNLVSYTAERDPEAGVPAGSQPACQLARRKHSFRGRFLVTDADGDNLTEEMAAGLIQAIQEALHARLSHPSIRRPAGSEAARRDSVASYATEASMDPDSPSYAAAAAQHLSHLQGHAGPHGFHPLSHLHPYAGGQAPHPHHHGHSQSQPHLQPPNPPLPLQPFQQGPPSLSQHDTTPAGGSALMSEASMSSVGSLLRATSDHAAVPSPPAATGPGGAGPGMTAIPASTPGLPGMSDAQRSSFSFLQHQQQQAQAQAQAQAQEQYGFAQGPHLQLPALGDVVATDTGLMASGVDSPAAAPLAQSRGGSHLLRLAQVTTPFASIESNSYQLVPQPGIPQQQQQQPPVAGAQLAGHSHSHANSHSQVHEDLYDLSTHLPIRSSSSSHTRSFQSDAAPGPPPEPGPGPGPGQDPGPELSYPGVAGSGRQAHAHAQTAGTGMGESGGIAIRSSGGPHVTFVDMMGGSASTSAAATSAPTPLHSRPPSASSLPFVGSQGLVGSLGAGPSPLATIISDGLSPAARACEAAAIAAATGAGGRMSYGGGASGLGGSRGDASPTGSSEDGRDGPYAWWSTLSAQDTVARIMSQPARSISQDADLGAAKALMTKHNISALLVDTGGDPGFITKRDFLKVQFTKHFKRVKVKGVMTQPVIFVDISTPIEEVSRVLEAKGVRRVLVRDPARAVPGNPLAVYVGVVSDADLFKCMGAPAMSPIVGSLATPTDGPGPHLGHATGWAFATTGAMDIRQVPLPPLPGLPSLSADPFMLQASGPSTGTGMAGGCPALSSVASTATSATSAGPSHAPSTASAVVGGAMSMVDSVGLACVGPMPPHSSGSIVRMNAECSFADRYRAAAALWELDFTEIEVTRRIGEGSFGEVLLANFRGTKVAVKRLRGFDVPDGPDSPGAGGGGGGERGPSATQMPIFRQFFEREIEILATIRHPNVVNFIGACHTPPNVCLVTEYCARGSLDHLLHKSNVHIDLLKKVEFAMDIARGMSCLHSQRPPIIHRDLKTANLLVSARFEVKVADFGLSRIKDHAQLINSRAGLEGTVEYAAPEVLRGEPYTEKCDIWSYSVLLWELLHRQRPYADADIPIYLLMMSLGNGSLRLPPVREDSAMSTPGLVRLVERCMAWAPADRPSFREVLHALEAEYKIIRGKAAAVPRSDSASSMMVLPGAQGRPGDAASAAAGQGQPHTEEPSAAHPPPNPQSGARSSPSNTVQHPGAGPASVLAGRKPSKLGLNPHGSDHGAADGEGPQDGHGYGSGQSSAHGQAPAPPRPRVKLMLPPGAGGGGGGSRAQTPTGGNDGDASASPSESSRPSTGRAGAGGNSNRQTGGQGHGGGGKSGAAAVRHGRSLRSAARSKSMPLPESEWFCEGEEESEDYIDTTESIADADDDGTASVATSASGAAGGARPALGRGHGQHTPPHAQHGHGGAAHHRALAAALQHGLGVHSAPQIEDAELAAMLAQAMDSVDRDRSALREGGGGEEAATASLSSPRLPRHLHVRLPDAAQRQEGSGGGTASSHSPGHSGGRRQHSADAAAIVAAAAAGGSLAAAIGGRSSTPFASAAAQEYRGSAGSGGASGSDGEGPRPRPSTSSRTPATGPTLSPFAAASGAVVSGPTISPFAAASGSSASPFAAYSGRTPPPAMPPRTSPFHAASNSPFADAAEEPWSPAGSDRHGGSPFSSPVASQTPEPHSDPVLCSPQLTPTAGAAAAATPTAAPAPRPRVTFVSPFAQAASEEAPFEAHGGAAAAGATTEPAAEASSSPRPPAAASTAHSTDVQVIVEKDQQPHAGWGAVLGVCNKPPSGNVHPYARPGAPAPSDPHAAIAASAGPAPHAQLSHGYDPHPHPHPHPHTFSHPHVRYHAHAGAHADGDGDGEGEGDGMFQLDPSMDPSMDPSAQHSMHRMASAVAGVEGELEALSLSFGTGLDQMVEEALANEAAADQFDSEDESTLHTTAWVRL